MLNPDYKTLKSLLTYIILDINILSGDEIGPSDSSWQDVAGTLSCNMKVYARLLDTLREGSHAEAFPGLNDLKERRNKGPFAKY